MTSVHDGFGYGEMNLFAEDGELLADPSTIPTFFLGYLGDDGGGVGAGALILLAFVPDPA